MVTEPSPRQAKPTAGQAQHNTKVNPWILTQKKKKNSTEQIRNQSTVTSLAEKTKYSPYKAKANQTPLPNTAIHIFLSKKKKKKLNTEKTKPQTQSKPNPRWGAARSGHDARRHSSLRRSSSLSTRRRLVAYPPFIVARREGLVADRHRTQIADRRSVLGCSGACRSASRYFSLSLSLSLKWKIWMWEYCLQWQRHIQVRVFPGTPWPEKN